MKHNYELYNNIGHSSVTRFQYLLAETLSDDPHLTETELIEMAAGVLHKSEEQRLNCHLGHCRNCANELSLLTSQVAAFEDPQALSLREARINRPQILNSTINTHWWRFAAFTPVLSQRPAYAAFALNYNESLLEFPVYHNSSKVNGCFGILNKHGLEYYLRVSAHPLLDPEYRDHSVQVVFVETDTGNLVIQREMSFDQLVLLGTELDVARLSVTARITP